MCVYKYLRSKNKNTFITAQNLKRNLIAYNLFKSSYEIQNLMYVNITTSVYRMYEKSPIPNG